ncbi:BamA/TamA family outer membrane protein [Flavobacteriaceae bacterium]|nr:BamA/TamA family outer membrane protein [Flavobacteriaceae bacterium]
MKNRVLIILVFLLTYGCSSVKHVNEEEFLLTKNKVYVDGRLSYNSTLKDYIIQRPNSTVLSIPISLFFYNLGNENFQEDYLKRVEKHPGKFNFVESVFTTKQALSIGKSRAKINQWLLDTGEAPVVYTQSKAEESSENLRLYYFNNGYFDAKVGFELNPSKKKKAQVSYQVNPGEPYIIDSITRRFPNTIIDSIYQENSKKSLIKEGDIYSNSAIEQEADRLVKLYRNKGIFHFNKNLVKFGIDTSYTDKTSKINFQINDRLIESTGENYIAPLKPQTVSQIEIFSDYSYNRRIEPYRDTVTHDGFTILSHEKLEYNPKTLTNSVFIKPNELYSDQNRNLTRSHLRSLNNFKSVKVLYEEINDEQLKAQIILTPLKKYNLTLNNEITHSNIKNFGITGRFSFLNRNTFRQAEIFKLSFSGSFFNTSADVSDPLKFFNAWEVGVDASLDVPRVLLPFNLSKIIAKEKSPRTLLSLGTSLQKNIGLDNQKYTAIFDLGWKANRKIKHQVELYNIQYVKNLNIDEYFYIYSSEYNELVDIQQTYFPDYPLTQENAIDFINDEITPEFEQVDPVAYQEAQNIEKRYYIITDNNFIPTIAYSFSYSTQEGLKDKDYSFFKFRIANAGGLFNLMAKEPEGGGPKSLFGAPIAQYVKLDLEYKKFWELGENNVLAYRLFAGFALPYGNATDLPFSRSYFVGGANDMRAWEIYELGPGAQFTGLEYNVSSMKLLTSLEYRFKMIGKLNGALFVDAGNIWDITDSSLNEEDAKFTGIKSLENAAIGSGFGARYDFSFLILRLDFGFKTYEPYNNPGTKWFQNYNFKNAVYNIGINYPF